MYPYGIISDHSCVASVRRLSRITAPTCYKAVRAWSKVDRKLLVKAIEESTLGTKLLNGSADDLVEIYY